MADDITTEVVKKLLANYGEWLSQNTILTQYGEWVEVTMPFLDRHNDYVQFYVRQLGDNFLITDEGATIADLRQSGCELTSKKRRQLLYTILSGLMIQEDHDELKTIATHETFVRKQHNLIQAMLAVNDLYYVSSTNVQSLFFEDVAMWLDSNDVTYEIDTTYTGRSGQSQTFSFFLPKVNGKPEKFLQAVQYPSVDTISKLTFAWGDITDLRLPEAQLYAILNDERGQPKPGVFSTLSAYGIGAIIWSERETHINELFSPSQHHT